jgi:hypothetical protein
MPRCVIVSSDFARMLEPRDEGPTSIGRAHHVSMWGAAVLLLRFEGALWHVGSIGAA